MTTIAYKAGVLAADSQCTAGSIRESHVAKLFRVGPVLVAGAGSLAILSSFVEWVKRGMHGPSPYQGRDCGNAMVVAEGQPIVVYGGDGPWVVNSGFYALGSGSELALGAMAAGKSAAEAVEIAAQFDVFTGGPVRTLSLEPR